MKPFRSPRLTKTQQIAKAKLDGFELGIKYGSEIAKELVKDGWKNLDKLPDEVVSRVTGKKRRSN